MTALTDLTAAFHATAYRCFLPTGAVDVRIGKGCAAVDALCERLGYGEWCVVTAANPGAARLPEAENRLGNEALRARLGLARLPAFPAENRADVEGWPVEEGYLVMGIAAAKARELGRDFGQAAVVCGAAGESARLVWCLDPPAGDPHG